MQKKTNKKPSFLRTSYFRLQRGFTLLEVIIAITMLLVGITAVMVLITKTVSQMNLAPSRLIAAYLTQEGIEIVRNIRDTNWLEEEVWYNGLTGCSAGCEADYTATAVEDPENAIPPRITPFGDNFLKIDGSGFYNYTCCDPPTKFKRKITITSGGGGLIVTVETTWTEKGQDQSHTAQEILYNWK